MLLSGFLVTCITNRLKLPNVSGYILAGIVIGPYMLNLLPSSAIRGMGFVGDIALAFIAFDVGKYIGAYIGSSIVGKPEPIKKYLGFALIPQAGVSIGLAFLGQRMLPTEIASRLMTIILSSAVLYELIGPAAAKIALFKSGAIKTDDYKDQDKV